MEVKELRAKSDSQLVTSQVASEFQRKDPQLIKYFSKVKGLIARFEFFEQTYVPREQNVRADLLSKLASTKKPGSNRTIIQEIIPPPSTETASEVITVEETADWRAPIMLFIKQDILPEDRDEAAKLRRTASKYNIVNDKLYKMGFSTPMLLFLGKDESKRLLAEIHDGECRSHIGARALAEKVLRAGFY
ncbi:gag-pol polyprotein [Trifolium medium]|uniref:Gag-pol polyprotein n=1 Tax=Trifolium medium TaxID=97028 RepID=A0A392MR99_9FABA|nr:gag-pol polyprotein [Trifolium medium]